MTNQIVPYGGEGNAGSQQDMDEMANRLEEMESVLYSISFGQV